VKAVVVDILIGGVVAALFHCAKPDFDILCKQVLRAVATGVHRYIYTLPKSGQMNFYGVKMTS